MDEQLLNVLGVRSVDEETLTFLKFALGQIDGNEGAKILDVTPNAFRVRAWRIWTGCYSAYRDAAIRRAQNLLRNKRGFGEERYLNKHG